MAEIEPASMAPGSTLRFRVEDRTRGVESSTWSVVGSKKSGDLYLSGRVSAALEYCTVSAVEE
jgi:hypothetical protein